VNGRTIPVNVYGPPGIVSQVDGSNKANKLDIKIRTESNEALNPALALGIAHQFVYPENGTPITVWSGNGVTVKAFKNDHYDVAVSCGYRIEYAGNVVVISGDTIYSDSVVQNSVGADILIHEATNMTMAQRIACLAETNLPAPMGSLIADHIRRAISHHSDVLDAAEVAAEAGVRTLVVSHIIPPIPTTLPAPDGSQVNIENLFTAGMSDIFSGSIYVAKDKMYFYLPPK
jgi:ribonuclease Z